MIERSMRICVNDHEAFAKEGRIVVVLSQDDPYNDSHEVIVGDFAVEDADKADALAKELRKAFPWAHEYFL